MKLEVPTDEFVNELVQKILVPGMLPANAITQIISGHLAESVKSFVGDRLIKPPTIRPSEAYGVGDVITLPALVRDGYTIWYPEIRFSTKLSDALSDLTVEPLGAITLGSFAAYSGGKGRYQFAVRPLKTQSNHIVKLWNIVIDGHIFARIKTQLADIPLDSPYLANPNPKFGKEVLFYKVVAFDHVLNGNRAFCSCARGAHKKMIEEAAKRASKYVPGSWPQKIVSVLSEAEYLDGICHMCIARDLGVDSAAERYGDTIRDFVDAYAEQLVIGEELDVRTAKAEVQARLGLSRWVSEAEMYLLIKKLFPDDMVLREASPSWLGRQRLDVFLPERRVALEYQGAQHFEPVQVFGGADALQRTIERDALKKRLCEENEVELIYVKHSDPLTLASLRHRLRRFI